MLNFRRPYITRFCVGEMGEVEVEMWRKVVKGEMVAEGPKGGGGKMTVRE